MAYESTYKTIQEVYSKFNELGIKSAYLIGGISSAIQANKPLYRQNGDIDLMVNSDDLDDIIQALSELGYTVDDKRGPLTGNRVTKNGQFIPEDHELNANLPKSDTSKLGIGLFVYTRENGVVVTHSYAFDERKNAVVGNRSEMPEELFDLMYDSEEITYNGVPLKCQSKAYTYYSKSKNNRPKDKLDAETIEPYIGETEKRQLARIHQLEKREVHYEEIFDDKKLVSKTKMPSMDEKISAYIKQLLGDKLDTLSPAQCKSIIFSNPDILQYMSKNEDINTIMKTFYQCPVAEDICKQLGDIAHSYVFDDDFSPEKFINQKDNSTKKPEVPDER